MHLMALLLAVFVGVWLMMLLLEGVRRIAAGLVGMTVAMILLLYGCTAVFSGNPADKPHLKVRAKATRDGWEVTVKGDAEPPFQVLLDGRKVGTLDGPGTMTLKEHELPHSDYAPGPLRGIKVVSKKSRINDRTQVCSPVVYLAARGTLEVARTFTGQNTEKFQHGIGSRGRRTLEKIQEYLGLPTGPNNAIVFASPVRYPAAALYRIGAYPNSRKEGESALKDMWTDVSKRCSDSQIVMLGYSQGADVVAAAWQSVEATKTEATMREAVTSVVLYADPRFPKKWKEQGVVFPIAATFQHNGLSGPRRQLKDDEVPPVQSWCYTRDTICQATTDNRVKIHGSEYDCYEQHAAYRIANEIAPGLREQGYEVRNPSEPTCVPAT